MSFHTECEELPNGTLYLCAHGELDLATASVLRETLAACADEAPRHLIVDLADVPFIDMSGLRVLVEARQRQLGSGGELLIGRPSRQVQRVLEIAGSRAELTVANDGLIPD